MIDEHNTRSRSFLNFWIIYFGFSALSGIIALILLKKIAPESSSIVLFGLSTPRLMIAGFILCVSIFFFYFAIAPIMNPNQWLSRIESSCTFINRKTNWSLALFISIFTLISTLFFLTLISEISEPFVYAIFVRLAPVASWLLGLSIISLILLLILKYVTTGFGRINKGLILLIAVFVCLGVVFPLWVWIVRPLIPEVSPRTGWNNLGVPVVEFQLLISWLAGILMLYVIQKINHCQICINKSARVSNRKFDLILCIVLWIIAVVLWQSIQITPSWFVTERLYPNYENYPASDARVYDAVAQNALVGGGLQFVGTPFLRRPIHGLYLIILHSLAGQDYDCIVFLQIMLLALFPVFIYLLVKNMANRVAGVMASVFIILREANSIALAGSITASHVKLLMVDLVTAFFVLVLTFLVFLWYRNLHTGLAWSIASGGMLGVLGLLRIETFSFCLPIIVFFALSIFLEKIPFKLWFQQFLLFCLGTFLVVLPWVWRNWDLTGLLFIDAPGYRNLIMQQRFTPPPDTPLTLENSGGDTFQTIGHKVLSAPLVLIQTPAPPPVLAPTRPDSAPSNLLPYFFAHLINNQLQTYLIFPSTFRGLDSLAGFIGHRDVDKLWKECCSLNNYVRRMPYWHRWDGKFLNQSIIPIFINMVILSVGISQSWKQRRFIGLFPLSISLTYLTVHAIFRNSGGRYILPVDWITIVYFSIGLMASTVGTIGLFKEDVQIDLAPQDILPLIKSPGKKITLKLFLIGTLLLCIGCAMPIFERTSMNLFPDTRKKEMLEKLMQSNLLLDTDRSNLENFLASGGVTWAGRLIYPQYFSAGYGAPGQETGSLSPAPYPRLVFYLAGRYGADLALPVSEKPPKIENTVEAIVVLCLQPYPDQPEPLVLGTFDKNGSLAKILVRSPFPINQNCPLSK